MDNTRVKGIRKSLKLTQAELANLMGVSRATVNRWENGVTRISRRMSNILVDVGHTDLYLQWLLDHCKPRVRGRPFQKRNMLT
jgi:transcriptional regulator with XRE-family HTH domain